MEIPGDGVVVESNQLKIDESSMTGETKPMDKASFQKCMEKQEKVLRHQPHLGHHDVPSNILLAGTKVMTGTGKVILINVGRNSAIGKIEELITQGEAELTPL